MIRNRNDVRSVPIEESALKAYVKRTKKNYLKLKKQIVTYVCNFSKVIEFGTTHGVQLLVLLLKVVSYLSLIYIFV